jgi:hypothetical protein
LGSNECGPNTIIDQKPIYIAEKIARLSNYRHLGKPVVELGIDEPIF